MVHAIFNTIELFWSGQRDDSSGMNFIGFWRNEHYQAGRGLSRGDSMHVSASTDSNMIPRLENFPYIYSIYKVFPSKV